MTGYNGAEYCSFKLKREADKYLKAKKKKEQQKQMLKIIHSEINAMIMMKTQTVSMQMKYQRKQMEHSNREMNVILS